jgi:hypothetical protein
MKARQLTSWPHRFRRNGGTVVPPSKSGTGMGAAVHHPAHPGAFHNSVMRGEAVMFPED